MNNKKKFSLWIKYFTFSQKGTESSNNQIKTLMAGLQPLHFLISPERIIHNEDSESVIQSKLESKLEFNQEKIINYINLATLILQNKDDPAYQDISSFLMRGIILFSHFLSDLQKEDNNPVFNEAVSMFQYLFSFFEQPYFQETAQDFLFFVEDLLNQFIKYQVNQKLLTPSSSNNFQVFFIEFSLLVFSKLCFIVEKSSQTVVFYNRIFYTFLNQYKDSIDSSHLSFIKHFLVEVSSIMSSLDQEIAKRSLMIIAYYILQNKTDVKSTDPDEEFTTFMSLVKFFQSYDLKLLPDF